MQDIPDFLPSFLDAYERVRGFRPRRMYISTPERYQVAVSVVQTFNIDDMDGGIQYDGCVLRHVFKLGVAEAIREWDLAP